MLTLKNGYDQTATWCPLCVQIPEFLDTHLWKNENHVYVSYEK